MSFLLSLLSLFDVIVECDSASIVAKSNTSIIISQIESEKNKNERQKIKTIKPSHFAIALLGKATPFNER
jgi:hypothetical protein